MLSRLHGMPADPGQLKHQYGESGSQFTDSEILRGAKSLGLKAKAISSSQERLAKTQFPAIAQHKDGQYFILAQLDEDKVLIQDPRNQGPESLSLEDFQERWNGQLILITRRAGILGEIRKFDFPYFAIAREEREYGDSQSIVFPTIPDAILKYLTGRTREEIPADLRINLTLDRNQNLQRVESSIMTTGGEGLGLVGELLITRLYDSPGQFARPVKMKQYD